MPERTAPARSVPGTMLVIGILAAAITGTAALRAGRVPAGSLPATSGPDMRIDVNTATAAELNALPGIGPALAERLAADRDARGPFECIDDLARVHGIGPKLVERVADCVYTAPYGPPGRHSLLYDPPNSSGGSDR